MPGPFSPFSLGEVYQTGEAIKGMRDQSAMAALQQKYLGQRMTQDAAQEQRATTQFNQEQQLMNTRLLNMAAAEVSQNPTAAQRWDAVLRAAIPNWEPVQGDPAQIQAAARQLFESTSAALNAFNGADGKDGTKYGVTPQFGVDAQGNPVPIQFNDQGEAVASRMPEGVTISRNPIKIDAGTEWVFIDPITRQPVSRQPKNIEGQNAQEEVGKWLGESYAEMQKSGMAAGQSLARYDRLDQLLSDLETGKLAGAKKAIQEYAQALGVDVEGLDEAQAFQALSRQLALEMRNPAGGAGMPGAMSDADREFLVSTVPNLLNTPGGNRQILDYARAVARRNQQVAAKAREYKRRTGNIDEGFFDELAQWSASNPMFTQQPKAPAAAPRGNAPQAAIDYLKQHPETREAFRQKYGYLPDAQ